MVANVPAKRGRKPAPAAAPATGQVQSLTRGLKLLEWIAAVSYTHLTLPTICSV